MNKKVAERIKKGIIEFRSILKSARKRDVNESDTVMIIHDMLSVVFGWDKYSEVTTEFEIRGQFCDLAIKHEGKIKYLIEVKAINHNLKENHLRQAINYAANNGTDWVMLTNGSRWQVYKMKFEKPIGHELIFDFDMLGQKRLNNELLTKIYTLSKEAVAKNAIEEYASKKSVLNKYVLSAFLSSQPILKALRLEIRRMDKAVKVDLDEIKEILETEIIKRELTEGELVVEARKRVRRSTKKKPRAKPRKTISAKQAIDSTSIKED